MIRFLIALSFLCIAPAFSEYIEAEEEFVLSSPDQIATLTAEPSYLIGGLISPLSGHPALKQTDLVVKGAQDIVLSRIYIPPYMPCSFPKHENNQEEWDKRSLFYHLKKHYKGWQFLSHLKLQLIPSFMSVLVTEPSGMTLEFRLSGPEYSVATLASPEFGISNVVGETPSGRYDPRNTRISYEDNGNKITVYATDGTTRFYYKKGKIIKKAQLYLLEKEIFPNGKVLKYHYDNNNQPDSVEALSPREDFVYASMVISGSPWKGACHFTSSSGITIDYVYERRQLDFRVEEKRKEKKHKLKLVLQEQYICPPILISVSSPSYRKESLDYSEQFLLKSFSGKREVFQSHHEGFGETPHYRVQKLLLPVGKDDAFVPVYELSYQPPIAGQKEGKTTVKNSDGTSTVYHFSKKLLTSSIDYFGQDGALKKEKVFSWGEKDWLKSIQMKDGKSNLLYRRSFEYDGFGNPIVEVFTGDLIGEGHQESYQIIRKFSEDGRNLLLEEGDGEKIICFSYLPNTNLVTAKLTKNRVQILLREFFIYDDWNNLIEKISDDGRSEERENLSGVTQRTLTHYTLRQTAPFLHMPEWVEEKYWEDGLEKPLRKSHYIYDQHGNVAQEELYDAEDKLAYTITRTYNERGDLLSETNPLGQEAIYTYDDRGRLETHKNFSKRIFKTLHHDKKGRLREIKEKGDDGIVHVSSLEYDLQDRLTARKDPFQNTETYTYDPLVSQVTRTDFPSIASEGPVAVATFSSYDPFGRKLTHTDANGNTTTYRYNAYGSPIEITHPSGSKESFRYEINGNLASHTDTGDLTIHYRNDALGRVLAKTYSAQKKTLAAEFFTYSGFNLLEQKDKEGNARQFFYDGAGRKNREKILDRITDFTYDALGWLASIEKHNEDNTLLIHYKRDLQGRIKQEQKTDCFDNILHKIKYSYDLDGNLETIIRNINGKEAIDSYTYDSFSRLTEHKDAELNITRTSYEENFVNQLGQKVLQTKTKDPRNITTVVTEDALYRTVQKEVLNPQGATLSCEEMTYDPYGNLTYRKDHVYEDGSFRNTQTVFYTYDQDNQRESLTRAFGIKEARTTSYTYKPSGKIATKALPNGITLSYSYHPLGFLSCIDSSDARVCHAFEYNKLGYLKVAVDENENIAINREVDAFGNVTQETFPNGVTIEKDYDAFDRLLLLKISGVGEIRYTYDPLFLRSVTRISDSGEVLYEHAYEEYDLDGNLVSEALIGNLGQVAHVTDLKGQKASISSPYFSQGCKYDGVGNLISNTVNGAECLYSYDGISQLSSEKSSDQSIVYAHDSLYNRTYKNGKVHEVNDLNELLSIEETRCSYDLNGNQILKNTPTGTFQLTYDPLNRLIEAVSEKEKIDFVYDPLGRRLSKVVRPKSANSLQEVEHYLYHGLNEIGAFAAHNELKNFRVLGVARYRDNPETVGIEIGGQVFAPILDVQGNIRRLIDLEGREASSYDFTAFGEELQTSSKMELLNPWRYASKRFDPVLGLIYFGKRDYDPQVGRWLSTDPVGFVDSYNLYQYVLNNPFRYRDPDGRFVMFFPLAALTWKLLAVAVVTAYVSYELEHHHHHSNSAFARSFNSAVHQVVQNLGGVSQYMLNQKLDSGKKKVRKEPNDLSEQLTLEEAKAKPENSDDEIMPDKIKDPKYPKEEWKKVGHVHERPDGTVIDIHYWENRITGEKHDFKFKSD